MDDAGADVPAFTGFPKEYWKQIASIDPIERGNYGTGKATALRIRRRPRVCRLSIPAYVIAMLSCGMDWTTAQPLPGSGYHRRLVGGSEQMKTLPSGSMVEIRTRKPQFPISERLHAYLKRYQRSEAFEVVYDDLLRFTDSIPRQTRDGQQSYWEVVLYSPTDTEELHRELTRIYAYLKTPDEPGFTEHLYIELVEFCRFGNSRPFRIKVVNRYNDNHDYYYVKNTDASRAYGLELEHILAPNRINFLVHGTTLIEEHITGIPGDSFLRDFLPTGQRGLTRIAKEFVKFSERSFAKLLGDMRSYNYVIVLIQDFDMKQYRVRAIDFDQQSYEGDLKIYLPQFYPENKTAVDIVWRLLPARTIRQYQKEERGLMARRLDASRERVEALLACMTGDTISTPDRISQLSAELARFHHDPAFAEIDNMGHLTRRHLLKMLNRLDR